MDVCPICFAASPTSPLNFAPTNITWNYSDPDFLVQIHFPQPMDVSATPLAGDFVLSVDGVPKVPDSVGWNDSTTFELEYSEALMVPVVVLVNFPTSVPAFRSPQLFQVQPFIIVGVEV